MERRANDDREWWGALSKRARSSWGRIVKTIEAWLAKLDLAPQRGAHDEHLPRQRPDELH